MGRSSSGGKEITAVGNTPHITGEIGEMVVEGLRRAIKKEAKRRRQEARNIRVLSVKPKEDYYVVTVGAELYPLEPKKLGRRGLFRGR
jgi:hypothetical protein